MSSGGNPVFTVGGGYFLYVHHFPMFIGIEDFWGQAIWPMAFNLSTELIVHESGSLMKESI